MKIGLLIIATGKYKQFVQPLLNSARQYFLKNYEVDYLIFTDEVKEPKLNEIYFQIDHKPWPHSTLMRFHFFNQYSNVLDNYDQLAYIDVDTLFVENVGLEVISPRCVVQHCGFVYTRGTYEERQESNAYVNETEGLIYYGGGFWSFNKEEFKKLVTWSCFAIDIDLKNNITPIHNDESILNRYMIDNPPTKILSPAYHYPEPPNDWIYGIWKKEGVFYTPRILLLTKNHKEVRDE